MNDVQKFILNRAMQKVANDKIRGLSTIIPNSVKEYYNGIASDPVGFLKDVGNNGLNMVKGLPSYVSEVGQGIASDPIGFIKDVGKGAESMAYHMATPVDNVATMGLAYGGGMADAAINRFASPQTADKLSPIIQDTVHNVITANNDRNEYRANRQKQLAESMGLNSSSVANSVKVNGTDVGLGEFAPAATAAALGAKALPKAMPTNLKPLTTYLLGHSIASGTEFLPAMASILSENTRLPLPENAVDAATSFRQEVRDHMSKGLGNIGKWVFPFYGIQHSVAQTNPRTGNRYSLDAGIPIESSLISNPYALNNGSWWVPSGETKDIIQAPVKRLKEKYPVEVDNIKNITRVMPAPTARDYGNLVDYIKNHSTVSAQGPSRWIDLYNRLSDKQRQTLFDRTLPLHMDALGFDQSHPLSVTAQQIAEDQIKNVPGFSGN
jgi:hypothetical protein